MLACANEVMVNCLHFCVSSKAHCYASSLLRDPLIHHCNHTLLLKSVFLELTPVPKLRNDWINRLGSCFPCEFWWPQWKMDTSEESTQINNTVNI